jgi:hypothetical protein
MSASKVSWAVVSRAPTRTRAARDVLALLISYVAVAAVLARSPVEVPRPCPFFRVTGHSCPLCGLTRALGLMSRGRWRDAIREQPLALTTALIGLAIVMTQVISTKQEV